MHAQEAVGGKQQNNDAKRCVKLQDRALPYFSSQINDASLPKSLTYLLRNVVLNHTTDLWEFFTSAIFQIQNTWLSHHVLSGYAETARSVKRKIDTHFISQHCRSIVTVICILTRNCPDATLYTYAINTHKHEHSHNIEFLMLL